MQGEFVDPGGPGPERSALDSFSVHNSAENLVSLQDLGSGGADMPFSAGGPNLKFNVKSYSTKSQVIMATGFRPNIQLLLQKYNHWPQLCTC